MKRLVNFLISVMISTLVSYPCKCMNEQQETDFVYIPNEIILSICKSANVDRNTLALVSKRWHKKAIELTTCISSPKSNSTLHIGSLIEGWAVRIPEAFRENIKIIRLDLTNQTPITKAIINDITSLNLKILTATYCNQLTDDIIKKLTTLETLKLISNLKLTDEALVPLNLKRLKLSQQKEIKGTFLQYHTNLTQLHLHGAYAITVFAISGLPTLKILSLKGGKYTLVDEDEELTKASNVDRKGSYSKDLVHLNKFGLHSQPNITLVDLTILPNLNHLALEGDLVISQQAMNLFEGKLGDEKFIKRAKSCHLRYSLLH